MEKNKRGIQRNCIAKRQMERQIFNHRWKEKKDEEGKKTSGYGNRAAQTNARRLIDCLTEWSDVISSFIKRDLDITINDGGNGIHSSGSSRSKSSNEIAQTTMKTTTTGPLREIERWKERNVERHTHFTNS